MKPCPFCGKNPTFAVSYNGTVRYTEIFCNQQDCVECGVVVSSKMDDPCDRDKVEKVWNRRSRFYSRWWDSLKNLLTSLKNVLH